MQLRFGVLESERKKIVAQFPLKMRREEKRNTNEHKHTERRNSITLLAAEREYVLIL